ncbi:MAG: ATP-binding protein [Pseudomonadota bacterium]
MDIIENSLAAGATLVSVLVVDDAHANMLSVTVEDNGRGMPEHLLEQAADPFYTTRTTRRVGLGLSLFRQTARRCDGDMLLSSHEHGGTKVQATFRRDCIDLPPMGDIAGSLTAILMGSPDADLVYRHVIAGEEFSLDTREIKHELDGLPISNPEVLRYLSGTLRSWLNAAGRGAT